MSVFVSSQIVDRWPARELIAALAKKGMKVECSPSNPIDRADDRWPNWYASGLVDAVRKCSVFVIVVEYGWSSATWMGIEADAGVFHGCTMCFWNPDREIVDSPGMSPYLIRELPRNLDEAVFAIASLVTDRDRSGPSSRP